METISKAIAGGLISAVVGLLARYGFHPHADTITAASAVVTIVVSYLAGHLAVYFAPANKPKI